MSNIIPFSNVGRSSDTVAEKKAKDAAAVAALEKASEATITVAAQFVRASSGLDAALRMLGRVADKLRNEGRAG